MIIFKSINKLNNKVDFKAKIGFVPTMGALHKGHISLIKKSKRISHKTLVSIYVNPTQFNKKKDFSSYPRNLKKDIQLLKKLKVDYLLIPKNDEVYKDKKRMKILIPKKDKILCAKYRPGHFEGVLAVINQFLINLKPKYLFLGEKDYQQIYLIKKFVKKHFKIKIINCKIIRINNLLPYSSRNVLLKKKDMIKAKLVSILLKKFHLSLKKNLKYSSDLKKIKKIILNENIKIDYFELRNKNNLSKKYTKKNLKIFIAYLINGVRLIDNI